MTISPTQIILASTSVYRQEILSRLQLPFVQIKPEFAETQRSGETPAAQAARLSKGKAEAVLPQLTQTGAVCIIGSDQVAHLNGEVLHKPGNFDVARDQLRRSSGQWVSFETGITLISATREPGSDGHDAGTWNINSERTCVETYSVQFRELSETEIINYLRKDEPWDCAGSFRAEGLGIALFQSLRGEDVNTLYGLPLLRLTHMLTEANINIL
ncbi:MAG: septum formation protein Maf [Pseudomonadales bacterium]|nr:septum formation protein Maf [Pseudomonadales bacterium]